MTTLRAQDAPRFRVMAGQRWTWGDDLDHDSWVCVVAPDEVGVGVWANAAGDVHGWHPGTGEGAGDIPNSLLLATLDESDPATLGTVEAMVREAWAGHAISVDGTDTHTNVTIWNHDLTAAEFKSKIMARHEAWAAALHAAPEAKP